MAAGCWQHAAGKAERNSPSPTKSPSSENSLGARAPRRKTNLAPMRVNKFQKKERLTSKTVIGDLFDGGNSFSSFPFKVVFRSVPDTSRPTQVLISVPARSFPKATERNTLKRRIREGYRLNKAQFTVSTRFSLAYIYTAREILPSSVIHHGIRSSIERLNRYEEKA